MKTRVLSPDEWPFVGQTTPVKLYPYMRPENLRVIVTEDEEGSIVGCLAVMRVSLMEGLWVAPAHRGRVGVVRSLLRKARELIRERGERWAFGAAEGEPMAGYLARLGGKEIPMDLYALSFEGRD